MTRLTPSRRRLAILLEAPGGDVFGRLGRAVGESVMLYKTILLDVTSTLDDVEQVESP